MNATIPTTLYRGVVIDYDKLQDFSFYGIDLKPYGEPIIDKEGRKLIGDGNEFGIYMTDYQPMAYSAYGNAHGGKTLSKTIKIGNTGEFIQIPSVGICYQIDTKGIDVRRPWISSALKGHYNNGFIGDEYITDFIPSQNITVTRIQIGSDFLHSEEFIDASDIKQAEVVTKEKVEARKKRLEDLLHFLETLPPFKRATLASLEKQILIDIFGEDGIRYKKEEDIDLSNASGILTSLMFSCYHQNSQTIDFKTMHYFEQLKRRLASNPSSNSVDTLLELVENDKAMNTQKRDNFIARKKEHGEEPITTVFTNNDAMYNRILDSIASIQKKVEQKSKDTEEKMHTSTIKRIETLLQIKINPIEYYVDPNKYNGTPYIHYKTVTELERERQKVFEKVDNAFLEGIIDSTTATTIKRVIVEEYLRMQKNAPQEEISPFQKEEEETPKSI